VQFTNVYKTQYLETPEGYDIDKTYSFDDKLNIIYTKFEDVSDDESISIGIRKKNLLYIHNFDGELVEIIDLNFDLLDGFNDFILAGDGTLYVYNYHVLLHMTVEGELIREISYENILDSIYPNLEITIFLNEINFDIASNLFYCFASVYNNKSQSIIDQLLIVLTTKGELVDYIKIDDDIKDTLEQLIITPDGQILLKCENPNYPMLEIQKKWNYYAVNFNTKRLTEYELPNMPDTFNAFNYSFTTEVYYGSIFASDYEIYYKDDYGLYGYKSSETESDLLLNWTNSDLLGRDCKVLSIITPDVVLCELEDIYSQSKWYSGSPKLLALLTRIPDDELAQKMILTIASVNSISSLTLKKAVVMFNRQSDKYRVIIDDYSIYNTNDDITRSSTFFNLDVISGFVHDMVFIDPSASIPLDSYIKKGMFADLYEFFDKDPDISRDYLLGCIRRNNETDGKLYLIPSYFTIYTLTGKPSLVGANENLTLEEIIKINNNLPPNTTLFTNCGRGDILKMVLYAGSNAYIDKKNAKCNFTDSSFIKMIEFVKTLPENIGNSWYFLDIALEEEIERVRNENSYLLEFNLLKIESFINLKYIYGEEDYVIKGFPNDTGNGSIINNFNFFTINSKSPNKAGAWEFIKFYMSDEVQLFQTSLPITNSAISYILDDYLTKYYYTNKNYINTMALQILDEPMEEWRIDSFDDFSFTKEDAVAIKRFLNDVPVVPKYDNTVFEIIYEEVNAFFAGAITAEQCAGYIQNRVQLYLHEQK